MIVSLFVYYNQQQHRSQIKGALLPQVASGLHAQPFAKWVYPGLQSNP